VYKRCDETDGYVCPEGWECAPAETTERSGCVPRPCSETGLCWDEFHICDPTSSAQRPDGQDIFGCVPRNCEEGRMCAPASKPDAAYCDPSAPNADNVGCVFRSCAEVDLCLEPFICAPGSPRADRNGCVIPRSPVTTVGHCVER
jgi:hypothetical protein